MQDEEEHSGAASSNWKKKHVSEWGWGVRDAAVPFSIQGYLAHKKLCPARTVQKENIQGPVAVLRRGPVSHERGTPVITTQTLINCLRITKITSKVDYTSNSRLVVNQDSFCQTPLINRFTEMIPQYSPPNHSHKLTGPCTLLSQSSQSISTICQ